MNGPVNPQIIILIVHEEDICFQLLNFVEHGFVRTIIGSAGKIPLLKLKILSVLQHTVQPFHGIRHLGFRQFVAVKHDVVINILQCLSHQL